MKGIVSIGLCAGLMLSALPLTAANRDSDGDVTSVISRPAIYRDSDGEVLSVICVIWVEDGRVAYRFDTPKGTDLPIEEITEVLERPDSTIISDSGATIRAGGQEYLVQARGDTVLLKDLATGAVYRGEQVEQATRNGRVLRANPKSFALD